MKTPVRKPLRLWPGVVIVILQWLLRFGLPVVAPEAMSYGVIGGLAGGLAIVAWWLFLSRAPWSERLGAVILMVLALFATSRFLHVSIATGAQGMLFFILAIPVLSLAFVVWAAATRHLTDVPRRATMAATILLACGVWACVQTGGFTGNFSNDLHWRWAKTPEERLIAQSGNAPSGQEPASLPLAPAGAETGADWPGFRGPRRDGVIPGVRIKTDWTASPPVELWRRPVGPGWSSFAARGDLLYTEEQRGPDEVVACYKLTTGQPVWTHRDTARFWESNAGAGPRGTPTVRNGRVYTFGATGIVNALDAGSGAVVWSRDAATDTGTKIPVWGFASSPLAIDDLVVVAAAGRLVAYNVDTGDPRWLGPVGGSGYSSPHLATIDGVSQILLLSGGGATSVAPADGTLLWDHRWRPGVSILQPALAADGGILITVCEGLSGLGMRRIAVAHSPGGWTVEERWTSIGLKPYYNDFVVHGGYVFGFDGSILACIDLKDGSRKWKGGRYGNGQLVLLPDQDLLLVLSEEGELALVPATPDRFTELARFPAIEGKTWNHPLLVGDVLVARNSQEMAAFRLSIAGR